MSVNGIVYLYYILKYLSASQRKSDVTNTSSIFLQTFSLIEENEPLFTDT